MPVFVHGLTPPPATVEVRIEIDLLALGDERQVSLWFPYTTSELRELRTYLAGEVANRDGAVSIWTSDDTELIIPSRTIRWLTITTRPLASESEA
jgi:hypothetical protein